MLNILNNKLKIKELFLFLVACHLNVKHKTFRSKLKFWALFLLKKKRTNNEAIHDENDACSFLYLINENSIK